jgi:hypothetical protein
LSVRTGDVSRKPECRSSPFLIWGPPPTHELFDDSDATLRDLHDAHIWWSSCLVPCVRKWLLFSATKKPKGQGFIPNVTNIIKNETKIVTQIAWRWQ